MRDGILRLVIISLVVILAGSLACQNARKEKTVSHNIPTEKLIELMYEREEIVLDGYPEALEPMRYLHHGVVTATDKDTIFLICSYPDTADPDRTPFHFLKDNHFNYWTMFKIQYGKRSKWALKKENSWIASLKEMTFMKDTVTTAQ